MTYPFGRPFLTQILGSPQDSNTQSENTFGNVKVHFPTFMKICLSIEHFPNLFLLSCFNLGHKPKANPSHKNNFHCHLFPSFATKFVNLFKPLMVHGRSYITMYPKNLHIATNSSSKVV
jgi:UDP-glucose 4-epimerase